MKFLQTDTKVSRRSGGLQLIALGVLAGSLLSSASAQTLTTLVNFNNTDGGFPDAGLIADANGNLFGTTVGGGVTGYGTVFELAKTSTGYAAAPTTLVSFNSTDGANPYAGLIADANGNLFGTTSSGGVSGNGTVFELAKTSTGYAVTPTTLVNFNSTDGASPSAGLITDANGNLFGTTAYGGMSGVGTVFEIAKTSTGYAATPTTLVNFNSTDGANPHAGLIADANGNLFGTTSGGGGYGSGTVFELAKTSTGYAAVPTTLVSFNYTDGAYPYAGLIADANGNLFGTTRSGGVSGNGTVFELAKTSTGYAAAPTTLVSFNYTDGTSPFAGLIADANGNLFGTTSGGGGYGSGTVFELAKTSTGYAVTPTTLVNFNSTDGAAPYAGLIADANGNLFGTTLGGGVTGAGTVFEVAGSGFVPPVKFAGVPGKANCRGVTISTLAEAYGGLPYAATALGYASVAGLQNVVATYCGP
jgi:hypothetical protein